MPIDPDLIAKAVAKKLEARSDRATESGGRAPDELGTVTGWRAWRVNRHPEPDGQVLLHSVSMGYFWVPFEKARASCDRCQSTDPHEKDCTPGDNCTCGFYCARTLQHLRTMGYHTYNSAIDGDVTIVGRVANWGKVIPGTQGWRAEYGYPERLYVPFEVARSIARPLADTYGVPVELLNLLDPAAKPGRKRDLAHVLPKRGKVPKFLEEYLEAHQMEGFEDVDE
jgi:hypothetical protein